MFGDVSVRKRLEARQVQFALFLELGSIAAAEIAGHAGYDVLLLDHEHSPYDYVNAIHCMNAARGTGAECWVRIPGNDQAYVKRILDSGADGIMCPMINTAEEARQFVSYCRFAPLGIRGFAPTIGRYTSYGYRREEYFRRVNADLAIMVQIETAEAVENAAAIAGIDGVSIVFIGPADLSNSLGFPGQFNHPTVASAFQRAEDAIKQSGKVKKLDRPCRTIDDFIAHGFFLVHIAKCVIRGTTRPNLHVSKFCASAHLHREVECLAPHGLCFLSKNIGFPVCTDLLSRWSHSGCVEFGEVTTVVVDDRRVQVVATARPGRGHEALTNAHVRSLFCGLGLAACQS